MAIITARNKETNRYQVFYNESPKFIFDSINQNLDIELVYKKDVQRRYVDKRKSINFYTVATFLYKFKN